MRMTPSLEQFSELQKAYDHFNQALFENKLPGCLLSLQRIKRTMGFFSANRFTNTSKVVIDEIAVNPEYFAVVPLLEVMQTLAHEMVHQWQKRFGEPGRNRYHNKEWGDKMEAIGLMPSSTGKAGGSRTGDRMSDYPIEGGDFLKACDTLLTKKFRIVWYDRFPAGPRTEEADADQLVEPDANQLTISELAGQLDLAKPNTDKNKTLRKKYNCMNCQINVWGKSKLQIICGGCGIPFKELPN